MAFPKHSLSPAELASLLEAQRTGTPFLAHRDAVGDLRLEPLDGLARLSIGRAADNELALDWDHEVSRTHAQLDLAGGAWTLVDDGLSRNGSFVNGERVVGRRRLEDGDMLRLGRTTSSAPPVLRRRARPSRTRPPSHADRRRATGARPRDLAAS